MHAQYAQQTQKKSGWEGWGVALVIFLIVAFIASSQHPSSSAAQNATAQSTLTSFCNDLTTYNYQDAYNQFSARVQRQESEQQFEGSIRQDVPTSCPVTAVQEKNTSATGTITYTFTSGKPEEISAIRLIKQNGVWKIDDRTP